MKTQRQSALAGIITEEMKEVARQEGLSAETIRERVAKGTIAICANINHKNPQGPRCWGRAFDKGQRQYWDFNGLPRSRARR
mgnify:CR=1 FL=1